MSLKSFEPGTTVSLAASTTSANVSLGSGTGNSLRVYNPTASIAFVRWGGGAQTATTSDLPIAPGSVEEFRKSNSDNVAAILAAGSGTLYFTPGSGDL